MKVYLDSSVILRWLLDQAPVWPGFGKWSEACTSAITRVEIFRCLDRLRLGGHLRDDDVARTSVAFRLAEPTLNWIAVTPQILEHAANPQSTVVKTLDAIHLSSAVAWRTRFGSDMLFVTHDRQQSVAAQVIGFEVDGSV